MASLTALQALRNNVEEGESSDQDRSTLAGMLIKGIIKPHISKVVAFEAMTEAHLQLETNRTVGKVVVKI